MYYLLFFVLGAAVVGGMIWVMGKKSNLSPALPSKGEGESGSCATALNPNKSSTFLRSIQFRRKTLLNHSFP